MQVNVINVGMSNHSNLKPRSYIQEQFHTTRSSSVKGKAPNVSAKNFHDIKHSRIMITIQQSTLIPYEMLAFLVQIGKVPHWFRVHQY